MSADICALSAHGGGVQLTSKIPILTDSPLRRSLSLRVKGEGLSGLCSTNSLYKVTPESNHTRKTSGENVLRRGTSFVERGEKRGNNETRSKTAVACRPRNVITEPRNQGALKGALTPTSPSRTRSLVSNFAPINHAFVVIII